jgi:hypothetical protein
MSKTRYVLLKEAKVHSECHRINLDAIRALEAKLKEVKAECQGHRDDHAPSEPKENELLEAIEQIVGRDMT